MSDTPNPGSAEAVVDGCTCPIRDNDYGRGAMRVGDPYPGTVWFIGYNCPVHRAKDYDTWDKEAKDDPR